MYLSLNEAAKLCGKSKSTISNAIKTGRLSANKEGKKFQIDPAALHGVFPFKMEAEQNTEQSSVPIPNSKTEQQKFNNSNILEVKLEAQDKLEKQLRSEIEDLKNQREVQVSQINDYVSQLKEMTKIQGQNILLIEHHTKRNEEREEEAALKAEIKPKGLFARMFS